MFGTEPEFATVQIRCYARDPCLLFSSYDLGLETMSTPLFCCLFQMPDLADLFHMSLLAIYV